MSTQSERETLISTLMAKGLTFAEASVQAEWQIPDPANAPAWVRTCNRPGCILTSQHKHGI